MQLLTPFQFQQVCGGIDLPERPQGITCECWTALYAFSYAFVENMIISENSDAMMMLFCNAKEMDIAHSWFEQI